MWNVTAFWRRRSCGASGETTMPRRWWTKYKIWESRLADKRTKPAKKDFRLRSLKDRETGAIWSGFSIQWQSLLPVALYCFSLTSGGAAGRAGTALRPPISERWWWLVTRANRVERVPNNRSFSSPSGPIEEWHEDETQLLLTTEANSCRVRLLCNTFTKSPCARSSSVVRWRHEVRGTKTWLAT